MKYIFESKFIFGAVLGLLLSIAGFPLWYRIYLKIGFEKLEVAINEEQAISDFGYCLVSLYGKDDRFMDACDKFYLTYLPSKTKSWVNGQVNPLPKFDLQLIRSTYLDIQGVRLEYRLEKYADLSKLSNGLL